MANPTPTTIATVEPLTPGHTPGEMNIIAHERTFDGFIRLLTWSAVLSILILIFLALTNS